MNLANRLTLFRVVLIPLIVLVYLFPYQQFGLETVYVTWFSVQIPLIQLIVLLLFAIASFTDFLDGHLARKHHWVTTLGGNFLDPIADKMLVNSLLILLAFDHRISVVAVLIMVARDTVVDGIRMLNATNGVVVAAGYLGKLKTVAQMIGIILVLLNNVPFEMYNLPVASLVIWFAALISVFSGISYYQQSKSLILESM